MPNFNESNFNESNFNESNFNESNFKWPLLLRETHFSDDIPTSATPDTPSKETSTMLQKSRSIFEAALQAALALYLGYVLSELLLKSLIPDSWAAPGVLISGLAFFFVLRWLRSEAPKGSRVKTEYLPFPRFANMPKTQLVGKSVYKLTTSTTRLCCPDQKAAPCRPHYSGT